MKRIRLVRIALSPPTRYGGVLVIHARVAIDVLFLHTPDERFSMCLSHQQLRPVVSWHSSCKR